MPTITLSIPPDLKKKMDRYEFINWSAVAREAITQKATELTLFKSIVAKSKLTPKDAAELANKINKAAAKRFLEMK